MKYKFSLLQWGDIVFAALAIYTGFVTRFGFAEAGEALYAKSPATLLVFISVLIVSSYTFEVYNFEKHHHKRQIISNIIIAVSCSFVVLSMVYFAIPQLVMGRGVLALSLTAFTVYQFLWHVAFAVVMGHPRMAGKILILGTGALARKIGDLVEAKDYCFSYQLVGYVTTGNEKEPPAVPEDQIVSDVSGLAAIAEPGKISHIIVSIRERRGNSSLYQILLNCKLQGIEILDAPSFFEPLTGKLLLEHMDIDWLVYAEGFRRTALISVAKRMVDILLALAGIMLSLPLLPVIALLVKLDSPGPVFFSQTRVGQFEKNFELYKFRTMCQDIEKETGAIWAQQDDPRVRPIGRLLRKWRFDEIPQLYNVLKGDMSFVGPRPERPEFVEELERCIPYYAKRHFIKPGITGWAQVRFPYGSSVEDSFEKLRYDLYYFKNMSPVLDTIILLKTFRVVIFGFGGR